MPTLSFNIRSPHSEAFEAETKMIFLECSIHHCTVMLWNKQKSEPEAVEVFSDIKDWEIDWEAMVKQSSILGYKHLKTLVFYGFPRFLPVPSVLFSPTIANNQLKVIAGDAPAWHYGADVMVEEGIVMYWEAPMALRRIFSGYFQQWQANSLATLLISLRKYHPEKTDESSALGLFLLSGNEIWLALWKEEKMLIVQNYRIDEPTSISYHMLNVCNQWNISPGQVHWYGYGMMEQDAPMWLAVDKFFGGVEPANPGIPFGKGIPPHYFAHHIQYLAHLK